MVATQFQLLIGRKVRQWPGLVSIRSSADTRWSGFPVEHQRLPAFSPSAPCAALKPTLLVVKHGETTGSWRAAGRRHVSRWRPGTVVFLDRGYQLNDMAFDAAREQLVVQLDESEQKHWIAGEASATSYSKRHVISDDQRIVGLIQCMYDEIVAGCPSGRIYGESLSLALISYLSALYAADNPIVRSTESGLSTPRLRRLRDYVDANLSCDLALSDLAAVVDLSPRHLGRSFKKATGMSIHQYVMQSRIERAKSLLCNGRLSMAELALALGFSSQSHFAVAFRKQTKMSPRQFLRRL